MIVLLGMPGCGKSSLAQTYAEATGVPWYDTDRMLFECHGDILEPIPSSEQWRKFRELEEKLAHELVSIRDGIISLGGGAWEKRKIRQSFLQCHLCVYLRCDLSVLVERLKDGSRVMFATDNLEAQIRGLLRERERNYRQAHRVIDTTNSPLQFLVSQLMAIQANEVVLTEWGEHVI